MTDIVLFHRDTDGYAAASIAYQMFGDKAEYYSVQYNEKLPSRLSESLAEDNIYILDFSYKKDICEELYQSAKSLLILDHHKTAAEELKGLDYAIFNMNHSGNILTWKHFFPEFKPTKYHLLAEDRDLWKFVYGDESKAFILSLSLLPVSKKDTKEYLKFLVTLNDEKILNEYIAFGYTLLKKQQKDVSSVKNNTTGFKIVNFKDSQFILYNTTSNISETAEAFYSDEILAAFNTLSYFILNEKVIFSMRSNKIKGTDVSAIAVSMGGGGHINAAGFGLPIIEGLELIKELLLQN